MKKLIKRMLVVFDGFNYQNKLIGLPDGFYGHQPMKHVDTFCGREKFGAPSEEAYQLWSLQVCGISSLKMITDDLGKTKNVSTYQMAQDSRAFGTFMVPGKVSRPSDILGIFHQGLLNYAKSFGLEGFSSGMVSLEKVLWHLAQGWFFLGSIDIFQLWEKDWQEEKTKGKHIVLFVGFKKEQGKITEIYYQDPSSSHHQNKKMDKTSFERMKKSFNRRGVFLKNQVDEKN